MDWSSAVTGLIAGGFASLIAPWAHWSIEKRKAKMDARRKLLSACRGSIIHRSLTDFLTSHHYSQIKSEFSEDLVSSLEATLGDKLGTESIKIQLGGRDAGANNFSASINDELTRIEKDVWKLL